MSTQPQHNSWEVFDHEFNSFDWMYKAFLSKEIDLLNGAPMLRNLVLEGGLLHLRQVVDILLSRSKDSTDIRLSDLVGGHVPARLAELETVYGRRKIEASPCAILNTRLIHPTKHRVTGFDYSPLLNDLGPIVRDIVADVRRNRPGVASAVPAAIPQVTVNITDATTTTAPESKGAYIKSIGA